MTGSVINESPVRTSFFWPALHALTASLSAYATLCTCSGGNRRRQCRFVAGGGTIFQGGLRRDLSAGRPRPGIFGSSNPQTSSTAARMTKPLSLAPFALLTSVALFLSGCAPLPA